MFRLGQLINKIRGDITRAVRNNRVTPGFVDSLVQRVFLRGKNAAYVTHGAQHGMPKQISQEKLQIWIRESIDNGKIYTVAFEKFLGAKEVTQADAARWLDVAGYQSTMQGIDSEALAIADEKQLQWKEWTRLFPRDEKRDNHDDLNGVIIPIKAKFDLGDNKLVAGPRDWGALNDPGEWINCGHGLVYHKTMTRERLKR